MKTINSLPATNAKNNAIQTAAKSRKSRKSFESVLNTVQKSSENLKNHLEVLLIMGVEHQRRYGDADLVAKALTAVATYLPVPKDVRKQAIQNAKDWCEGNTPHTYFLRDGEYTPSKKDINWNWKLRDSALFDMEKQTEIKPLSFVDELKAKKREERKGRAAKVRETESVAAINADLLNAYIAGASMEGIDGINVLVKEKNIQLEKDKLALTVQLNALKTSLAEYIASVSLEQLADIESLLKARKAELKPVKKGKKQEETAAQESQAA